MDDRAEPTGLPTVETTGPQEAIITTELVLFSACGRIADVYASIGAGGAAAAALGATVPEQKLYIRARE